MKRRELGSAIAGAGAFLATGACLAAPEAPDTPSGRSAAGAAADALLVAYGREAAPLIAVYASLSARFFDCDPNNQRDLDTLADEMCPIGERLDQLIGLAIRLPAATQPARAAKGALLEHEIRTVFGRRGAFDWQHGEPYAALSWSLAGDVMRDSGGAA